jgi:hypothetical protein
MIPLSIVDGNFLFNVHGMEVQSKPQPVLTLKGYENFSLNFLLRGICLVVISTMTPTKITRDAGPRAGHHHGIPLSQ